MAKNAKHRLAPAIDTADMTPRELTKQEFGRRLQALQLNKGWNQSELARKAGLGRDAISSYINGRSFPEPKNLHMLARALDIEPGDLLPNAVIGAVRSEAMPMIETRQAVGQTDKAWIHLNCMVTPLQAAQINAILQGWNLPQPK